MNTFATDTKPWYKQFWFWFVIGIPLISVVMGIALVYVASINKVSLVKEEWYKDGLAINQRIDKQLKAKELGLTADISLSRETGALMVTMPQLQDEPALILTLVHPTQEEKDETIELTRTPDQSYWAKTEANKKGFFYMQLTNPDNDWQLDGTINFNNNQVNTTLTAD
ncbi:MAG: nitrogen fixation protein FixH [Gammaproteobacteria bacterium]|nr:MAG: nitrogen fixation protein FixH [Gammaproteobacteria bacterium]